MFSQPSAGTGSAVLSTNGRITYTPPLSYAGQTTFQYTTCATVPAGNCVQSTITMNVLIYAADDSATTNQNTPKTIAVLNNDPGSYVNTTVTVTNPGHGTAVVNLPSGTVTYTPTNNFVGTDTFTYTVCAATPAANCDTADVVVTVLFAPQPDSYTTTQVPNPPATTVALDVLTNDAAPGLLDSTTLTIQTAPGHGTAVRSGSNINYTPVFSFAGDDTFVYRVCVAGSGGTNCGTAQVTVRVKIIALPR